MAAAELELKSPLIPLFQRGTVADRKESDKKTAKAVISMESPVSVTPLWKRGEGEIFSAE
jgi:hypothetical protein